MSDTASPNADQAQFWNEAVGRTWSELSRLLDRQMDGVGLAAIDALDPRPGEAILDVGCGTGRSSEQLAERVGPSGWVVGLDISAPLLEIARRSAAEARLENLAFLQADAQTYAFEPESFDGLYSRFGVMFFADPVAAFRNLLSAMKPGGRIALVVWRSLAENPLLAEPLATAGRRLPLPPPAPPGAPGPFGLADPDRTRTILSSAGFDEVSVEKLDMPVGGNSLDDAHTLAIRLGPVGAMTRENPAIAPLISRDIREVLARHVKDGEVWMDGAFWLVTAKRP